MPNNIEKFKKYVPLLDEVYKQTALTSVLDSDSELAQAGANANEIIIPKIDMDGLGAYDRNSGYTNGDATLTNETVRFNYERGRMLSIDSMDNEETAGLAYGKLAGEFIRTKVAPEGDAFRFAKYSEKAGTKKEEALANGKAVVDALRTAVTAMDEAEVSYENRFLFITPTLKGMIDDLDTTKSREVLAKFAGIVEVPQTRFYTAIDLLSGKDSENKGGYKKSENGKELNFLIVEKSAILQYNKHIAPKVVSPEQNQNADAWKFGYRKYGLADVYENKTAGVYVSHKA